MNNNDLRLILSAKVSLVVIETYDEPRALSLLDGLFKYEKITAANRPSRAAAAE